MPCHFSLYKIGKCNEKKDELKSVCCFFTHRRLVSARPYNQPFRGSWTSTMTVSPLLKGKSFGLEEEGCDTRALMGLPPPKPRDSPTELERERLGRGDGAGESKHKNKIKKIEKFVDLFSFFNKKKLEGFQLLFGLKCHSLIMCTDIPHFMQQFIFPYTTSRGHSTQCQLLPPGPGHILIFGDCLQQRAHRTS